MSFIDNIKISKLNDVRHFNMVTISCTQREGPGMFARECKFVCLTFVCEIFFPLN